MHTSRDGWPTRFFFWGFNSFFNTLVYYSECYSSRESPDSEIQLLHPISAASESPGGTKHRSPPQERWENAEGDLQTPLGVTQGSQRYGNAKLHVLSKCVSYTRFEFCFDRKIRIAHQRSIGYVDCERNSRRVMKPTNTLPVFETLSRRRSLTAVASRDARMDSAFVYGVRSTGIYCRPSCPSRRPRPTQIQFFAIP